MTTIAYRSGMLAADTAVLNGYNILGDAMVKIAKHHGCLAGATGTAGYCAAFLKWFCGGEQDAPPKAEKDNDNYDTGIIVRPDGSIDRHELSGWHTLRPRYYAVGSGRDHAFGAMFAGATAEQAVRAAIEHDPGTAGSVTVLRLQPGDEDWRRIDGPAW